MVSFPFPRFLVVYKSRQPTNLDVIRIYQSKTLADKHSMYELAVMRARERQSKSFEDQVLARHVPTSFNSVHCYLLTCHSPDYQEKDTLVLVIHDPYVDVITLNPS